MTKIINKPSQTTYYVLINGSIHFGIVESNQVMESGLNKMETFFVKEKWIDRLLELGISNEKLEIFM